MDEISIIYSHALRGWIVWHGSVKLAGPYEDLDIATGAARRILDTGNELGDADASAENIRQNTRSAESSRIQPTKEQRLRP
jgi:hypothetical protein